MKMQFKTICQRHYNRTHTHSHWQQVEEENVKMKIIMKERRKMNYEVCELRTWDSPAEVSTASIWQSGRCVREGQVNGIKMIVCIWVCVRVGGCVKFWHAPRLQ